MTTKLHISHTLSLPVDWMMQATVVYGARGSGKTVFGSVLGEEVHKAGQRFCAIDLKGDFYGLKSTADGKRAAIPAIVFGGDHADVPLEADAGAFIGETVAGLAQSCVLDLEHFSKGKQVRFLHAFFASLYDHNREPLLLLLDECQRYAPQKPIDPDAAKCLGAVEDLVKLGRKHGIGTVLTTQRGSGLNKEVSELCELLVAFRTPGPLDQERIKGWLDANTTRAERESVMGQLAGLPTGTAVFASGHPALKVFGVHKVRMRETFDSSATPKIGQRRSEPKTLARADLSELRTKMAAAIERAKAEDPKALRARIAELDGQIRALKASPAKVETKEVPVLSDEDRELMKQAALSIERSTEALCDVMKKLLQPTFAEMTGKDRIGQASVASRLRQPEPISSQAAAHIARKTLAPLRPIARGPGESMPDGELAILKATAQYPEGATREQLSILTGYKRSTRDSYVQRLSAKGYVTASGGLVLATVSGVAALGSNFEPLPTGDALLVHWLQRLPDGERRVLEYVCRAYPRSADRDAISEATGYKRSTRDSYIQRLGVRKLVTAGRDGVIARPELFG